MTDFGIIHLPVVPVRAEASDRSEQVNQLLFGELIRIEERNDKWARITSLHDDYSGWIDLKQFRKITQETADHLVQEQSYVALDLINPLRTVSGQVMHVPAGSSLPQFDGFALGWEQERYAFYGKTVIAGSPAVSGKVRELAERFTNVPYLWGGRSAMGMDCSGFTQVVFKLLGKKLRRDASQQVEQGTVVNFIEEAREGDLAFFDNEEGRVIHVGIVLENHKIIHASGCVRIDNLDHNGIYQAETRKYSHNLRIIKRLL